jgi:hypothetical protein
VVGTRIDRFAFGTIRVGDETFDVDVVIDRGAVRPRKKKPSRRFRDDYGHTPLSLEEKIPWKCARLVIGTGAEGALPVMPAVLEEGERRGVEVVVMRTDQAIKLLRDAGPDTNAVLHITC